MRNLVVGIFGVMTVATSLVYAAESPAHGDDEIRRVLIHSGSYIDSDTGESDDLAWALTLCENDTNRMGRIIYELAHTNNARIAERMILHLGTWLPRPSSFLACCINQRYCWHVCHNIDPSAFWSERSIACRS